MTRSNLRFKKAIEGLNNKKMKNLLHFSLALFIILWLNGGILMYVSPYIPDAVKVVIFFIWFFLACLNKGFIKEFINGSWPLIAFMLILAVTYILNPNSYVYSQMKNIFLMLSIFSIFVFYFKEYAYGFQKLFVYILSIDYLYIGINTMIKLQQNPFIARWVGAGTQTREMLLGPGIFPAVGGYTYIYSLVIVVLMLIFTGFKLREFRWVFAVICLISTVLIIKAQFTISILLLLGFVLLMLLKHYSHRFNKIVFTAAVVSSVCVLLYVMPFACTALSKWAAVPGEVAIRCGEIADFMSFNAKDSADLGNRIILYAKSFETFLLNPVLGSAEANAIGGHSSWLDMLALFGLLSSLLFEFFRRTYGYIKSKFSSEWKSFVDIYWLYYAILGLINTALWAGFPIVLFIYIPFFLSIFDRRKMIQIKMNPNR